MTERNDFHNMLKLYRFLKPFTYMVIGVFTFVFLQTLGDLYLPTLMSDIINEGVLQGDTNEHIQFY
jgi:ATP-binding cassette subfamily B protein